MANEQPHALINYKAYRDGYELIGITDVTLPNMQAMTAEIKGAGFAGVADLPILGHFQAMSIALNFRTVYAGSATLLKPKAHHVEFCAAIQNMDTGTGEFVVKQHKVITKLMPKQLTAGTLGVGVTQDRAIDFEVSYLRELYDGEEIYEFDKFNFKYVVGGEDILAPVRSALGD